MKSLSHVRPFTTPWTAAYQAPLPMGFARQKYWSRNLVLEVTKQSLMLRKDRQVFLNTMQLKTADIAGKGAAPNCEEGDEDGKYLGRPQRGRVCSSRANCFPLSRLLSFYVGKA